MSRTQTGMLEGDGLSLPGCAWDQGLPFVVFPVGDGVAFDGIVSALANPPAYALYHPRFLNLVFQLKETLCRKEWIMS